MLFRSAIAKKVYASAYARYDELAAPYASVIDISMKRLPSASEVEGWSSEQYVAALRHDKTNPQFNQDLRQLLHVGYKVAAELGDEYLSALDTYKDSISKNVTFNLFERHLKPLFLD